MALLWVTDGRNVNIHYCMYKELYRELNIFRYGLNKSPLFIESKIRQL